VGAEFHADRRTDMSNKQNEATSRFSQLSERA